MRRRTTDAEGSLAGQPDPADHERGVSYLERAGWQPYAAASVDVMDRARRDERAKSKVDPDLVEYIVIVVPDLDSLESVASALADLVAAGAIRVLDLVVVVRKDDGTVVILEPEAVASLGRLAETESETGALLSDHDIEMLSLVLEPARVALVVVTEDRWAEGLSMAVTRAGGLIVAGERIPGPRMEAALADRPPDEDRPDDDSPRERE